MSVSSKVYMHFQVGKGNNPKTQHFVFMIENPIFSTVSRPSTTQKEPSRTKWQKLRKM
jgi:hypothetical protein